MRANIIIRALAASILISPTVPGTTLDITATTTILLTIIMAADFSFTHLTTTLFFILTAIPTPMAIPIRMITDITGTMFATQTRLITIPIIATPPLRNRMMKDTIEGRIQSPRPNQRGKTDIREIRKSIPTKVRVAPLLRQPRWHWKLC